ncbi:MAG: WbuC family cupin fold metalloprotein [Gammaproteobacteria bacterium]|nr:WbuC family cupin fold metalloprotein [Gammaproteobacteria bacterium]
MKVIDATTLNELTESAIASPRRRKNLNLHDSLDDAVQRFLNAFEPGTYVRPHRHSGKWELFVLIQGRAAVLGFDDAGTVVTRVELNADNGARVVEIPASTWHTIVSLAPRTVMLEVKRGPYDPSVPAEYAPWAPAENDAAAAAFERRLQTVGPPR